MSSPAPDVALDYLPALPRRLDFRIGCIGAGFIMRDCHLVAYRQAGFNPVAIASRDPAHAKAVAEARGIPRCFATVEELLADQAIEVLDIAVPPDVQPGIIRKAVQHADHLRGIAVKDFVWGKDAKGAYREQWKPIGEGVVKLPEFFGMVAQTPFEGPLQIHFEYPLGGAQNGTRTLTIPKEDVLGAMKQDLDRVRGMLAKAGL